MAENTVKRGMSILIMLILAVSIIPIIDRAYAIEETCNGHNIERDNFDDDGNDEVKVDGIVYNHGQSITLGGKTYTIIIGSGTITGTIENDFIVGTNGDDIIYGYEGDDFIVGLDGNDLLYGDGISGTNNNDTLEGGDDILCGGNGDDELVGDSIAGFDGDDTITGGNDKLEGGNGDDNLYGDYIAGFDGDDTITGGNDKLEGGNGDDNLYGDYISGGNGDDTITGGDDELEGGDDGDSLYGDFIYDYAGDDTITGGNDTLDSIDNINYNDNIDGDLLVGDNVNEGLQDICASDPDDEENCEYDDISTLATLTTSSTVINPGDSIEITFTSNVDNIVKITSITVTTPSNNVCTYADTLPIIVEPNGTFTVTYPDQFVDSNNNPCNTDEVGEYTVILDTEVGDPIVTVFNTSFNVVSEVAIGAIGIASSILGSMMLYRRLKR